MSLRIRGPVRPITISLFVLGLVAFAVPAAQAGPPAHAKAHGQAKAKAAVVLEQVFERLCETFDERGLSQPWEALGCEELLQADEEAGPVDPTGIEFDLAAEKIHGSAWPLVVDGGRAQAEVGDEGTVWVDAVSGVAGVDSGDGVSAGLRLAGTGGGELSPAGDGVVLESGGVRRVIAASEFNQQPHLKEWAILDHPALAAEPLAYEVVAETGWVLQPADDAILLIAEDPETEEATLIGTIVAPDAIDAAGTHYPVTIEITSPTGFTLEADRIQDAEFPVAVDPRLQLTAGENHNWQFSVCGRYGNTDADFADPESLPKYKKKCTSSDQGSNQSELLTQRPAGQTGGVSWTNNLVTGPSITAQTLNTGQQRAWRVTAPPGAGILASNARGRMRGDDGVRCEMRHQALPTGNLFTHPRPTQSRMYSGRPEPSIGAVYDHAAPAHNPYRDLVRTTPHPAIYLRGFLELRRGIRSNTANQPNWVEMRLTALDRIRRNSPVSRCRLDGAWSVVMRDNQQPTVERHPVTEPNEWLARSYLQQANGNTGHPLRRVEAEDRGSGIRQVDWWVDRVGSAATRPMRRLFPCPADEGRELIPGSYHVKTGRATPCPTSVSRQLGIDEDTGIAESVFPAAALNTRGRHTATVRVWDFTRRSRTSTVAFRTDTEVPTCRTSTPVSFIDPNRDRVGTLRFLVQDPGFGGDLGAGLRNYRLLVEGESPGPVRSLAAGQQVIDVTSFDANPYLRAGDDTLSVGVRMVDRSRTRTGVDSGGQVGECHGTIGLNLPPQWTGADGQQIPTGASFSEGDGATATWEPAYDPNGPTDIDHYTWTATAIATDGTRTPLSCDPAAPGNSGPYTLEGLTLLEPPPASYTTQFACGNDEDAGSVIEFTLTAFDRNGLSATTTVSVAVPEQNLPPEWTDANGNEITVDAVRGASGVGLAWLAAYDPNGPDDIDHYEWQMFELDAAGNRVGPVDCQVPDQAGVGPYRVDAAGGGPYFSQALCGSAPILTEGTLVEFDLTAMDRSGERVTTASDSVRTDRRPVISYNQFDFGNEQAFAAIASLSVGDPDGMAESDGTRYSLHGNFPPWQAAHTGAPEPDGPLALVEINGSEPGHLRHNVRVWLELTDPMRPRVYLEQADATGSFPPVPAQGYPHVPEDQTCTAGSSGSQAIVASWRVDCSSIVRQEPLPNEKANGYEHRYRLVVIPRRDDGDDPPFDTVYRFYEAMREARLPADFDGLDAIGDLTISWPQPRASGSSRLDQIPPLISADWTGLTLGPDGTLSGSVVVAARDVVPGPSTRPTSFQDSGIGRVELRYTPHPGPGSIPIPASSCDPRMPSNSDPLAGGVQVQCRFDVNLPPGAYHLRAQVSDLAFHTVARSSSWGAAGSLVAEFGTEGVALTPVGTGDANGSDAVVADDGTITTVGVARDAAGRSGFGITLHTSEGQLVESFLDGGTGVISRPDVSLLGTVAGATILQTEDGVILVGPGTLAGAIHAVMVRLRPDGSVDQSFGDGGWAIHRFGASSFVAGRAALDAEGRILVAGRANSGMAVARLTADGQPDPTFGTDGLALATSPLPVGPSGGIAVAPDGRIAVVGGVGQTTGERFAAAMFTADGAVDTGFGDGGLFTYRHGGIRNYATAAVFDLEGNLYAGGWHNLGGAHLVIGKLLPDGSLDPGFGDAGFIVRGADVGTQLMDLDLLIQPDGKVLAAGAEGTSTQSRFMLLRAHADGSPDTDFGDQGDGIVATPVADGAARANSVQLLEDGTILAAGFARVGTRNAFALAEYIG